MTFSDPAIRSVVEIGTYSVKDE
ncbi:hypothetical protein BVI2075_960018 [Burkholderia vietnamiensis]|nr:hypothetical protein BVI2075_960018 [Burkholderia vietnamiensis]